MQYPDYEWQAGSLANGNGTFKAVFTWPVYFANGDISLNHNDVSEVSELDIYPSPAYSHINLNWSVEVNSISIYDNAGRCVV